MDVDCDPAGPVGGLETLPEVLLPTQMDLGCRFGVALGERRLLWAMLLDAVACFCKYRRARDNNGRKLFREAERWFRRRDDGSPFSFAAVCDVLGLNARQVRLTLLGGVYGKTGELPRLLCDEDRRLSSERRPRAQRSAGESRGARVSELCGVRTHRPALGDGGHSSLRGREVPGSP
jgi:hypothetical protein